MGQNSRYTLPGYDPQSGEIIFSGFPASLYLSFRQALRLWYEEDYQIVSEDDNDGTSCGDVFAKYF